MNSNSANDWRKLLRRYGFVVEQIFPNALMLRARDGSPRYLSARLDEMDSARRLVVLQDFLRLEGFEIGDNLAVLPDRKKA